MADVGEVRARYILETSGWEAGMAKVVSTTVDGGNQVKGSLQQIQTEAQATGQAVADAGNQVEAAAGKFNLGSAASAGVAGLQKLAGSLQGFRQEITESAGRADDLADKLKGVFGDAADEMAALSQQQIVIGIDPEAASRVLTTLNKFGLASKDNLQFVEDASAKTGVSMDALAEKIGRIAELGDAKAFKGLSRQLGATKGDLEALGVAFDKNNNALLDTPERVNAAVTALQKFGASNFSGAAEAAADDATKLKGEMELLRQEVGASVISFQEGFAPALRDVVGAIRGLPPELKTVVGLGTEFISIGANVATTGLQVATNFSLLATNTTLVARAQQAAAAGAATFQGVFTALLGALSPLVIILGSVAIGLAAYTAELEKANAAAESLLATEEKRAEGLRKNKDVIGQTAEALKQQGKTTKDVTDTILGLQDQAQAAYDSGNKATEAKIREQIRTLIKVRSDLAALEKSDSSGSAADSTGPAKSQKEQAAEDAKAQKELSKASAQAAKDLGTAFREAAKAQEDARKEALAEQLADIKNLAAAGEISKAQEIARYQEVLKAAQLSGQERRAIEASIAQLKGQIRAEDARQQADHDRKSVAAAEKNARETEAARKKAADDAKRKADAEQAQQKVDKSAVERLAKEQAEAQKAALDSALKGLDDEIGKNTGAIAKVQTILQQRLAITIAEIRAQEEVEKAATKSENVKAAAATTAEAKIQAARAATNQQFQDYVKKQNDGLQSIADKHKDVQKELDQPLKSQVGGDASPLSSDPNQGLGIQLGKFNEAAEKEKSKFTQAQAGAISLRSQLQLLDKEIANISSPLYSLTKGGAEKLDALRKKRSDLAAGQAQAQPQAGLVERRDDKASAQQAPAPDVGKQVADSLKEAPISITVAVTSGGKTKSQTFSDTPSNLAKNRNIFNPDFDLGGF